MREYPWLESALAVVAVVIVSLLVYPGIPPSLSITGRAILLVALLAALLVLITASGGDGTMGFLVMFLTIGVGLYLPVAVGYAPYVGLPLVFVLGFVTLGVVYYAQEGLLRLPRRQAFVVLAVLLVASSAFLVVDLTQGEVTYDLSVRENAVVDTPNESVVVGTATAHNTFALREPVRFSEVDVDVCLYVDGQRFAPIYGFDTPTSMATNVPGHGNSSADLTVRFSPDAYEGIEGTLPIERAETCPADRSDTVLVVATGAE